MATVSPSLAISSSCHCCRSCGPLKSSKLNFAVHCSISRNVSIRRIDGGLIAEMGSNAVGRKFNLAVTNAKSRRSVGEAVTPPTVEVGGLKKASTYLFRTEVGNGLVKVSVTKKDETYVVYVEVSSLELGMGDCRLMLVWGIYRSDSSSFLRTMNTSFMRSSLGKFSGELEFEAEQSPFYLSFLLKSVSGIGASQLEIRSHRKTRFCLPIGFGSGSPAPLGLSFSADGSVNFALFSRNAQSVVLCLYDDDDTSTDKPALELELDSYVNKTGDIWHASFEGVGTFRSYGFRCKTSNQSNAGQVLSDPYAKVTVNSTVDGRFSLSPKYLGKLCKEPNFDWNGDVHPNLPMQKLVGYRLNVQRFTQHRSSLLSSDVAGTFAGVAAKVKHFKDLGINAVLIEPIFPFDEHEGPYFPYNFFSPSSLYGPSGDSVSAIRSMKEMVKTLHANGIEVFMEVVFGHTSESGALQGIDDSSYYYANKGMGLESSSALNCNYPVVTRMILDSLRHWVTEFRVDGFCFMDASSLLRGFHGETLSRPPLIEAIAFEPLLSKTKIIADFWDPQEMLAKENRFPHWKRWGEMNMNFCRDVRNFLRGEGPLSSLATRLCGSGDIFSSGRGPAFGFNYVARNSGLPLVDLVSFSSEVLASEFSWNCGEEGPTGKTLVLERRLKQIRNYLFILFVSLGVPVLNMGDECGQSAGGSTSYRNRKPLDWNALTTGFGTQTTQFISYLSALRARRSDLLQKGNFLDEENIEWYGNDESPPKWDDPSSKFLAMELKTNRSGSLVNSESADAKGALFVAFNAGGKSAYVLLPLPPKGMEWRRLVDTALPYPGFFSSKGELAADDMVYEMKSHSCVLFEAISCDD